VPNSPWWWWRPAPPGRGPAARPAPPAGTAHHTQPQRGASIKSEHHKRHRQHSTEDFTVRRVSESDHRVSSRGFDVSSRTDLTGQKRMFSCKTAISAGRTGSLWCCALFSGPETHSRASLTAPVPASWSRQAALLQRKVHTRADLGVLLGVLFKRLVRLRLQVVHQGLQRGLQEVPVPRLHQESSKSMGAPGDHAVDTRLVYTAKKRRSMACRV
jgi:hypothetical protein